MLAVSYSSVIKRWVSAVLIFFAWGFVMHGTGLLLHEFGGHGLAALVLGKGIDGYKLTFFGHGQVIKTPYDDWTLLRLVIVDWSGLVITSAVGVVAAWLLRRKREWPPMWRLLIGLVAFFFLIGQLGYATSGGFHDLYDPKRTAVWLGKRGRHALAWLPTMMLYALSAVVSAREVVDAYREHFGTKTRLHTLGHFASTLGVAGVMYFLAFRIEWQVRTDLAMRGVEVEAVRVAAEKHVAPPFPIHLVLLAISLSAVIWAFARPIREAPEAKSYPKRLPAIVALSAAGCFLVLFLLIVSSPG
jgi:hypothetical protein